MDVYFDHKRAISEGKPHRYLDGKQNGSMGRVPKYKLEYGRCGIRSCYRHVDVYFDYKCTI